MTSKNCTDLLYKFWTKDHSTVVHILKCSDRRKGRHLVKERRSVFEAFKLTLRSSDYFQVMADRTTITYIMVPSFVSSSGFKTTTAEGAHIT